MIRILVVNGSPHENRSCGNVTRFIQRLAKGMQVDIFWLGKQVAQCDACRSCKRGGFSRRSGNTSAFSRMNMYFLMHSMIVVGSQYWNELYSDETGDTKQDAEGMETVASLVETYEICH